MKILNKTNSVGKLAAGLIALSAFGAIISTASVGAEVWEELLGAQLQDEHKCTLAGTLYVRELPSGTGVVLSGRARCFDGREFDFSQSKPHMKFEIRACDPTYC